MTDTPSINRPSGMMQPGIGSLPADNHRVAQKNPDADGLKTRALRALHPTFKPHGAIHTRPMYKAGDIKLTHEAAFDLSQKIDKQLNYKTKRLKTITNRWFSFRRTAHRVDRREKDIASLKSLKAAADRFCNAVDDYLVLRLEHQNMRQQSIPYDPKQRSAFLKALEKNSHALAKSIAELTTSEEALKIKTHARKDFLSDQEVSQSSKRWSTLVDVNNLTSRAMAGVLKGEIDEHQKETEQLISLHKSSWRQVKDACTALVDAKLLDPAVLTKIDPNKTNGKEVEKYFQAAVHSLNQLDNRKPEVSNAIKMMNHFGNILRDGLSNGDAALQALRSRPIKPLGYMLSVAKHEAMRTSVLRQQLESAQADKGDLSKIVGDQASAKSLMAGDALQALRSGEPISPYLKNVIDGDKAIVTQPKVHGKGASNTVYSTMMGVPDETGRLGPPQPYILKPLSGRVTTPGSRAAGLPTWQTRAFSRQLAAHNLTKRLGFDLVAEPKLVRYNGKLCMAMPEVKGHTAGAWVAGVYKGLPRDVAKQTVAALHKNKALQHKMKEVQITHAVTGNVDGHGNNLKIKLIDPISDKEITPAMLARMGRNGEFDKIANLKVEAGLFDMDGAFSASEDPLELSNYSEKVWKTREDGKRVHEQARIPAASHGLGPPPFHTAEDREKIAKLINDLGDDSALRDDFVFCLTSGKNDRPDAIANEIDAMRSRAQHVLDSMDAPGAGSALVDANTSANDLDKHVENAPKVATFKNSGVRYVEKRAACIEKFFPKYEIY